MCDPAQNTEAALLVPVLWGLRNCLHGNAPNKDRFFRAGGLETLVEVRQPKKETTVAGRPRAFLPTRGNDLIKNPLVCRARQKLKCLNSYCLCLIARFSLAIP